MSLQNTIKHMKELLEQIAKDLFKAENRNKAASQRVRTGTIKLEKIAKLYRKESVKQEKSPNFKKQAKKTAKKPAKKAAKASAHHHAKKAVKTVKKAAKPAKASARPHAKKAVVKKHAKKPAARKHTAARSSAMSMKRRTATKRAGHKRAR